MLVAMFSVRVRAGGVEATCEFPWPVSIVSFMANPQMTGDAERFRETLRWIAEDPFFDAVEIPPPREDQLGIVREAVGEAGLRVMLGAQPAILNRGLNPSAPREEDRRSAVRELKSIMETAASLGVDAVAICSGPDPGPGRREAAVRALRESLRELYEEASRLGTRLVVETFDRDWDRRLLLGPIREAADLLGELRGEGVEIGLLWDLSHAPMLGERPSDLKAAAGLLAHVHIGCAKRLPDGAFRDSHPGFYRPGAVNGVEEVEELIGVLASMGYRNSVGFEVKPEEGQLWQEVVQSAKGVLYTAYARYVRGRLKRC